MNCMMIKMAITTTFAAVSIFLLQNKLFAEATSTVATNTEEEFSNQNVINSVQEIGREISYAQWSKNPPPENVILSPFSIAVILNLLLLGTDGTTNLEIKEALNYPNDLQENLVHETYQEIFTSLPQSGSEVEISLYTRLFPQEGFTILDSFTDVSQTSYLSEVESLDYRNFPEASTDRINNWVSDSTNGKIKGLFSDTLSHRTVCVIANVILLNATWEYKFNSGSTKDGNFFTGNETIIIPMMNREMPVPYWSFKNEGFEMISLPYVGNRFSMYILKPLLDSNLQQIENNLNSNDLNTFISQLDIRSMNVTIPRMRLSLELDLKIDLKSLGVNEIFSDTSDFTRFTDDRGVFVSAIAHKAILEVTEAGTVAAAVTAGVVESRVVPKTFELNKPSLVFIRDNENGLILFWGKVMNPEPFLG